MCVHSASHCAHTPSLPERLWFWVQPTAFRRVTNNKKIEIARTSAKCARTNHANVHAQTMQKCIHESHDASWGALFNRSLSVQGAAPATICRKLRHTISSTRKHQFICMYTCGFKSLTSNLQLLNIPTSHHRSPDIHVIQQQKLKIQQFELCALHSTYTHTQLQSLVQPPLTRQKLNLTSVMPNHCKQTSEQQETWLRLLNFCLRLNQMLARVYKPGSGQQNDVCHMRQTYNAIRALCSNKQNKNRTHLSLHKSRDTHMLLQLVRHRNSIKCVCSHDDKNTLNNTKRISKTWHCLRRHSTRKQQLNHMHFNKWLHQIK